MKKLSFLVVFALFLVGFTLNYTIDENRVWSHTVDPSKGRLHFFLNDNKGAHLGSLQRLKNHVESTGKQLNFAMNGGMYLADRSPQGLYIENGKLIKAMNKVQNAYGNFYLQPNGVFFLSKDHKATVVKSTAFVMNDNINYATQSGPMLVIDGDIHPKFTKGSTNLNIRNGVGILPDGKVLFAMSKAEINLYDFATYFQQKGCKNALYLDGFVSRTYLPSKGVTQLDGNFGVMIGEVEE